jgi:hypothetical protein
MRTFDQLQAWKLHVVHFRCDIQISGNVSGSWFCDV